VTIVPLHTLGRREAAAAALAARRWAPLGGLAAALALLLRPPCDLPVPNLWTVGALGVFGIGVWQYRLFQDRLLQVGHRPEDGV